ncbi:MAG: STAS domain-containing protein [Rhodospirillales bacterium]|jgi:anti-anti-sigma factor|nr:STAS domain-containing protein [Rhodospirillales bacterium]
MSTETISLPDNFDSANALDFRSAIPDGTTTLIIDFKETHFVDSAGIGTMVFWLRDLQKSDGKIVLANLTGQPKDIVEMVGLNKLVEVQ